MGTMTVFFFWAAVGALLFLGVGAVAAALMGKTPFQTARDSTLTVLSDDYAEIDRDREAGLWRKVTLSATGDAKILDPQVVTLNISRQR